MEELLLDCVEVEEKLIRFIKKKLSKAGFSRVVLGISGGVDSATAAYLSVKALGSERVFGAMMPYKTSSKEAIADARCVIKDLGIKGEMVDITSMIDSYFEEYQSEADNIRRGNKMARERMSILYDLSKKYDALVLGSSNKTELLLGYGTIYGDIACALNPLGDLYKTQVRQLASHLRVPQRIVDKVPTADLWPGQTDEGELGYSYAELDRLLFHLIEEGNDLDSLRRLGFSDSFILDVVNRLRRHRFKVHPPEIAVLTDHPVFGEIKLPDI
jgi:NAD+ synthase